MTQWLTFVRQRTYLCLYKQNYCKNNQPIKLKIDVMIGRAIGQNLLCWWSWSSPRYEVRISFLISSALQSMVTHFRRFIRISRTVTGRFSRTSVKWLAPTKEWTIYILGAIQLTSVSRNLDSNPGSLLICCINQSSRGQVHWSLLSSSCCNTVVYMFMLYFLRWWIDYNMSLLMRSRLQLIVQIVLYWLQVYSCNDIWSLMHV